jgi:hypothetical protein
MPAVQDSQEQESELLLPITLHSSTEGAPLVNPRHVLDVGEALHRNEGDCMVFSVSAKTWHSVLYSIHMSSQPVENPLTTSHLQSGNSVCTGVTVIMFELTRVRVMQVSSVLYF